MILKIDLVKLGRCSVCGALLEEMAILEGLTTCSVLCSRAKVNGRGRDEQERWEGLDKKMSDMGKRNKGKKRNEKHDQAAKG